MLLVRTLRRANKNYVVIKWLKMCKLKLNEDKTKLMVINSNCDINLVINGKTIENVRSIKCLGVIIDKELKFNYINYMCKKIGKKIGF